MIKKLLETGQTSLTVKYLKLERQILKMKRERDILKVKP